MQMTARQRKWPKRRSEWPEKKWTPPRTWSRGPDDLVISSLSDFDPPSLSSITKSMGIFPFKQLMYRWQKLSQSSCTYRYKGKREKRGGKSQRVITATWQVHPELLLTWKTSPSGLLWYLSDASRMWNNFTPFQNKDIAENWHWQDDSRAAPYSTPVLNSSAPGVVAIREMTCLTDI